MNQHRPAIYFERIDPETTTRQLGDALDHDIAETVRKHYGTPQRQASDALALVAIALFCGTLAIIANLMLH